jgi:uncharacterized protein YoxC
MNSILLGLMTLAFIAGVIIFILTMMQLRKTILALNELAKATENSLKPTFAELQETLDSVRNMANNVTAVSEDTRVLSGALRGIGENVERVSGDIKHLVNFVDGITSSAVVEASGLKAGVKAGFWFFVKSLLK